MTQQTKRATRSETAHKGGERTGGRSAGRADALERMDTAEMVKQLLGEKRLSSLTDVHGRTRLREAMHPPNAAPATDGQTSTQDAIEDVSDPLRALLETGLFDEETRAMLEEIFTHFNRKEADAASEDDETVDAQQLYREFKETFEEFHESLKRIFRLVGDAESEEPWPTEENGNREASFESVAAATEDADDTAADRASEAREALIERIVAVTRLETESAEAAGDEEGTDDAQDTGAPEAADADTDDTYTRLASAYEARYDVLLDDERPVFSTEG